jgi:hypothetical protein
MKQQQPQQAKLPQHRRCEVYDNDDDAEDDDDRRSHVTPPPNRAFDPHRNANNNNNSSGDGDDRRGRVDGFGCGTSVRYTVDTRVSQVCIVIAALCSSLQHKFVWSWRRC